MEGRIGGLLAECAFVAGNPLGVIKNGEVKWTQVSREGRTAHRGRGR